MTLFTVSSVPLHWLLVLSAIQSPALTECLFCVGSELGPWGHRDKLDNPSNSVLKSTGHLGAGSVQPVTPCGAQDRMLSQTLLQGQPPAAQRSVRPDQKRGGRAIPNACNGSGW